MSMNWFPELISSKFTFTIRILQPIIYNICHNKYYICYTVRIYMI